MFIYVLKLTNNKLHVGLTKKDDFTINDFSSKIYQAKELLYLFEENKEKGDILENVIHDLVMEHGRNKVIGEKFTKPLKYYMLILLKNDNNEVMGLNIPKFFSDIIELNSFINKININDDKYIQTYIGEINNWLDIDIQPDNIENIDESIFDDILNYENIISKYNDIIPSKLDLEKVYYGSSYITPSFMNKERKLLVKNPCLSISIANELNQSDKIRKDHHICLGNTCIWHPWDPDVTDFNFTFKKVEGVKIN